MMGNQQNVSHKKEEKMNLLHFLCMNVFDQLCVHKILRLTQIPRLQKNKKILLHGLLSIIL